MLWLIIALTIGALTILVMKDQGIRIHNPPPEEAAKIAAAIAEEEVEWEPVDYDYINERNKRIRERMEWAVMTSNSEWADVRNCLYMLEH
ncbi:MAG TPA: hypothetical protein EYP34_05210 [Chromatiaceae bacterium]|nr:hypothetical protein [Chromatiaceae bacterium]